MEKIEFTRFIERYLEGKMQSSEKQWFEKEIEGNLWLQKELELRRKADKIVSNLGAIDLRSKLMEVETRHKDISRVEKAVKKIPVNYAALFLGLILISTLLILSGNSFDIGAFTDSAVDAYSVNTTSRSDSPVYPAELMTGMQLYSNDDFGLARTEFAKIPDNSENTIQSKYLLGLSNMQLKEYSEAVKSFTQVIDHNDNMFLEDSEYYLGLCYYNLEDMNKAKIVMEGIISSENRFRKDAKKILKNIK